MKAKLSLLTALFAAAVSGAMAADPVIPKLSFGIESAQNPGDVSLSLQILLLMTVLSLAPGLLVMVTSFTRIVIVLSLTRGAIGTQQVPPNSVVVGLALFLTFFTMAPVLNDINQNALQPYFNEEISFETAISRAETPVRNFMFSQVREKDIALFIQLSKIPRPKTEADVPTYVLIPAFLISELKTAFSIGFMIYIPFLVIDMVISVSLMSMGMMMLPPILISLPFKILLFVLVDGWHLIAKSLTLSFQ